MPHTKLIVGGIAALLAIGAIASTASAEFKFTELECTNEGIPTLCLEFGSKLFEAEGAETYLGKLTPGTIATFLALISEEDLEITCGKDESTGEIVQISPLVSAVTAKRGILKLSECRLIGTLGEKCKIPTEKATFDLEGTVINEMPIDAGVVKAESGSVIMEIPIQQRQGCPATLIKTYRITGDDLCTAPEAEVDKVVHLGECSKEGSRSLLFDENEAIFECMAEVELSGANKGRKWDVSLG